MLYALPLSTDALCILIFAAALVGFVLFLWLTVRYAKKTVNETDAPRHEAATAAGEDADPDEAWTPPEPIAYPARVVDMHAVVGYVAGGKSPKTDTSFLVTFLTDEGERVEYPVPEELYVTLDVDQTGTLVILNGYFFDFGDGEEVG